MIQIQINLKFYIVILLFVFYIFNFSWVSAQEMSSPNFKIQGGNFNITSGEKSSGKYKLTDTVGQTIANQFASKGYVIQSGFQNSFLGSTFNLTISPTSIDFGQLFPGSFNEKNMNVRVANGQTPGYIIKFAQNHLLTFVSGSTIANTACNLDTKKICSKEKASQWSDVKVYGFGYRVIGKTAANDFDKEQYFRPFPSTDNNEEPVTIMESKQKNANDSAGIILRVNPSSSQPVGLYTNTLTFEAIPRI